MILHWLHPALGLIFIPVVLLSRLLWRQYKINNPWEVVCEPHLLKAMLNVQQDAKRLQVGVFIWLVFWCCITVAIMGPAIEHSSAASFQSNRPTIIILDMSPAMFVGANKNMPMNQVKLALHSWLTSSTLGPWALILFTEEAYLAAPLTDDGKTLLAILPELTAEVMPVSGYQPYIAFDEAQKVLQRAGFSAANVLLVTHKSLSTQELTWLNKLPSLFANIGIVSFNDSKWQPTNFTRGKIFLATDLATDIITNWLSIKNTVPVLRHDLQSMVWHDLGRWFLLPAAICLLVFFRRGYVEQLLA